jgi:hypothetical protein
MWITANSHKKRFLDLTEERRKRKKLKKKKKKKQQRQIETIKSKHAIREQERRQIDATHTTRAKQIGCISKKKEKKKKAHRVSLAVGAVAVVRFTF